MFNPHFEEFTHALELDVLDMSVEELKYYIDSDDTPAAMHEVMMKILAEFIY